jgi:hypothetical protein
MVVRWKDPRKAMELTWTKMEDLEDVTERIENKA